MKILIINSDTRPDTTDFDETICIAESAATDIFCFIPNRQINSLAKENLCFIPYGPNSWEYKQNARAIGCQIGDDKFKIIDTNITFPFHKDINLQHNEELGILTIVIKFLFSQNITDITLSEKVDISNEKENMYLEKLIDEKKIKILNE